MIDDLLSASSYYEASSTNPWRTLCLSVVRQVHEYYAEFCAVNEDFFSANCPETLQLALPRPPAAAKTLLARNRDVILSVLLALKKKPSAIRYAVSDLGCAGDVACWRGGSCVSGKQMTGKRLSTRSEWFSF